MQAVGAGLGNDVDNRSGVAAVLGVKSIGQYTEFLDAVRGGLNRGEIHELIVGIATINAEIIGTSAASVD